MARPPSPPAECAQCGAEIPPRALACPECGADERTGWRETSIYDGLDLPDTEDTPASPSRSGLRWYWIVAAALVLAVLILGGLALR